MSGFSRRGGWRRCVVLVASTVIAGTVGLASSACSGGEEAAQAENAAIRVQTSQLFVTVENNAGAPLINMTVAIVPLGAGSPPFTRLVTRMENGEKRDISLNDFASRDGTIFSLRVNRPKAVRVTAEDVVNKKHDVQVAWR